MADGALTVLIVTVIINDCLKSGVKCGCVPAHATKEEVCVFAGWWRGTRTLPLLSEEETPYKFYGLLPECHAQNLAETLVYVPHSQGGGEAGGRRDRGQSTRRRQLSRNGDLFPMGNCLTGKLMQLW